MNIKVFTSNSCAYCSMVKKWLSSKNISYEEVNISDNPERQQEAIDLSGALTTPVTLITKGDKQSVVVGFNLSQLAPLIS